MHFSQTLFNDSLLFAALESSFGPKQFSPTRLLQGSGQTSELASLVVSDESVQNKFSLVVLPCSCMKNPGQSFVLIKTKNYCII